MPSKLKNPVLSAVVVRPPVRVMVVPAPSAAGVMVPLSEWLGEATKSTPVAFALVIETIRLEGVNA